MTVQEGVTIKDGCNSTGGADLLQEKLNPKYGCN